jgi:glycerophosphoryl diester phosphodiesterase
VNRLEAETFYAEVVVRGSDGEKTIDSRPSDALALALQFDTSIFVASQVLSAVEEARSTRPRTARAIHQYRRRRHREGHHRALALRAKTSPLSGGQPVASVSWRDVELLRSKTGRIAISAHRGASGYAPENTMAAFRLARELGADILELDVHLTRDDRLVVHHDDSLDRTTSGTGYVRDRSWDELRHLDAGGWCGPEFAVERIPLLEEVLAWSVDAGMPLSLELKRPNPALGRDAYPDLAARVVGQVQAHRLDDRVLVFSDDHAAVKDVRSLAPDISTGIVLGSGTFIDPVGVARQAGADGVYLFWRHVSREFVETCHSAGLHVFGFGVGDDLTTRSDELIAMLANGTDFVSSGHPDRLRAFVAAWQADLAVSR